MQNYNLYLILNSNFKILKYYTLMHNVHSLPSWLYRKNSGECEKPKIPVVNINYIFPSEAALNDILVKRNLFNKLYSKYALIHIENGSLKCQYKICTLCLQFDMKYVKIYYEYKFVQYKEVSYKIQNQKINYLTYIINMYECICVRQT